MILYKCFLGNKTLLIAVRLRFDSIISNHCRIPVPLYWVKRWLTLSVQIKAGLLVYLWALVYLTLFICGWRIGTFAQSVCIEKFGKVFQDSWGFWFLVAVAVCALQARLYSRLLLFQPQVAWFHRQSNGQQYAAYVDAEVPWPTEWWRQQNVMNEENKTKKHSAFLVSVLVCPANL